MLAMPRKRTAGVVMRMRLMLTADSSGSVKLSAPTSQATCGANSSTTATTASSTSVARLSTMLRTRHNSSRRSRSA